MLFFLNDANQNIFENMKTKLLILFLFCFLNTIAQDQILKQQLPVFNEKESLIIKQKVAIKVYVLLDSIVSKVIYTETHTTKTSKKGIVEFEIGKGNHENSNPLNLNPKSNYFLNIEIDLGHGYQPYITTTLDHYQSNLLNLKNTFPIGKKHILISGPKTDKEVSQLMLMELGPNTESIEISKSNLFTSFTNKWITSLNDLKVDNNEFLHEFSLPNLSKVENELKFTFNPELCFFNFDTLSKCKKINMFYNRVNTLIFPKLSEVETLIVSYNPNLTDFKIPSLSLVTGFYGIDFTHNSFSVETVDTILEQLLKVKPLERKSVKLISQDPPAFPSPKGITAKNKLNEMGNFVSTD